MSTKKISEPRTAAPETFTLLKIPYAYEYHECAFSAVVVDSLAAANELMAKYKEASKDKTEFEKYYYVLVAGTIVPPARWIEPVEQFAFHP